MKNETLKRLQTSKAKLAKAFDNGKAHGQLWANEYALVDQLDLLENEYKSRKAFRNFAEITSLVDMASPEVEIMGVADPYHYESRPFANGFVEGALEVLAEFNAIEQRQESVAVGSDRKRTMIQI